MILTLDIWKLQHQSNVGRLLLLISTTSQKCVVGVKNDWFVLPYSCWHVPKQDNVIE